MKDVRDLVALNIINNRSCEKSKVRELTGDEISPDNILAKMLIEIIENVVSLAAMLIGLFLATQIIGYHF